MSERYLIVDELVRLLNTDEALGGMGGLSHIRLVKNDVREIVALIQSLAEALEKIDALEVMEINPSNYDHDDVCELNSNAVQAVLIARAALKSLKESGSNE
jgi:hypothetical protein